MGRINEEEWNEIVDRVLKERKDFILAIGRV